MRTPDGGSDKELLEGLLERAKKQRNSKKIKQLTEELYIPPLPVLCQRSWQFFLALEEERKYGAMGDPHPLQAADILAWQQLYSIKLRHHELKWIKVLDRTRLTSLAEYRKLVEKQTKD